MTIKEIRDLLNKCPELTYAAGDIDDFWSNEEITVMLTHTVWCEGEDNDNHKLLIFKRNTDEEPILITEFIEKIEQ